MITRLTSSLATAGWLILVIFLPVWLLTGAAMPWLALLLLLLAPLASVLLQLALSRTREFDADLDAARITGDPYALARALQKLEQGNKRWWNWLIPIPHKTGSFWVRSHPSTQERVQRLRSLTTEQQQLRISQGKTGFYELWHAISTPTHWHNHGVWY